MGVYKRGNRISVHFSYVIFACKIFPADICSSAEYSETCEIAILQFIRGRQIIENGIRQKTQLCSILL